MKVLFLASYFPKPDNTVMGTWALKQAQALVRQGVDLRVLSFNSLVPNLPFLSSGAQAYAQCPQEYEWEGQVKVKYPRWLYYPINPIKKWSYANPEPYLKIAFYSIRKTLISEIKEFNPDIIFCHHSLPNGWMVAQLPSEYQRPLFILEHDYEEISDCFNLPKRLQAFNTVMNSTTSLMGVSKRMSLDMKTLFPKNNIFTHHNGININLAATGANEPSKPVELEGKFIFLSCALFAERKGIPLLIKAFSHIAAQYPQAILRIIGGGPEEELVKNTVASLQLEKQVQLLGKQPHDIVLREMHWADCFALVGWNEPFATVYLEAMAAGKAIVCCDDGGINDVITNGKEAFVVPPKNIEATAQVLKQILDNPNQIRQMGKNAKRLIETKLTWDVKTKELVDYFSSSL